MNWNGIIEQFPKSYKRLDEFLIRRNTMFRKAHTNGYIPLKGEEDILNDFFLSFSIIGFVSRRLEEPKDTYSTIIIMDLVNAGVNETNNKASRFTREQIWLECFKYLESKL